MKETELDELIKNAQSGDSEAQYRLGECYYYGNGIEQDYKKAVEWYEKSAEQGYAKAQNNLGFCYGKGYGVEKNLEKEVEWYIKSAEQGNSIAQRNLGKCYYYGNGIEKDIEKARILWEKSSQQGYLPANSDLGVYYLDLGTQYIEERNTVEQFNDNYEKAMEYFLKNKNPSDYYEEKILKCLDRLNEVYINENKNKSLEELYEKLIEFNSYKILTKLEEDYENGNNVKKDLNKSLKCYLKMAEREPSEQIYSKIIDLCNNYADYIENSERIVEEYSDKIVNIKDKENMPIQKKLEGRIDEIFGNSND